MKESFQIVALSILAAHGELEFADLLDKIEERSNKKLNLYLASWRLGRLVGEGYINMRATIYKRPKSVLPHNIEAYFSITDDGRRKRIDLAREKKDRNVLLGGPRPAFV